MIHLYDLVLGLPHTNRRGLWEPRLLMQAGHMQWSSIATASGGPLSRLRTRDGGEVYAAFYYIEERVPDHAPFESFGLDAHLRFAVSLRSFKNLAIEGRVVFDRVEKMPGVEHLEVALSTETPVHPWLRFGNIFITPVKGNSQLRVAPPAAADFSLVPPLPNDENPYHYTRAALQTGELGLFDASWSPVGETCEYRHVIDPDRDTNGAGLVYFAQYITFMEAAERVALHRMANVVPAVVADGRSLRHRRVAYYGNADIADTITVRVSVFRHAHSSHLGFRYAVSRSLDGQRICLSEAVKAVTTP